MSLYLLDGHALAYRSYFAFIKRPLVNSRGEETSAVFGFAKTVMNILDKFSPEYLAVIFDSVEKTFRHEIFPEYKAHREKMPDAMIAQLPRITELLEAMAIPSYSMAGFEADDIIATLSRNFENEVTIRIISGDKDLFQLINKNVHIIRPAKGGLLEEEIGPDGLTEKTGLKPEHFVDFLSLMGDSSDNIPGVRGVGEKTALKLIKEYGSLENVFENVEGIEPASLKKKLLRGKDDAYLSRQLITLNCQVPIAVSIDDLAVRGFNHAKLVRLLHELEFSQLIETLSAGSSDPRELSESEGSEMDPVANAGRENRYILIENEDALRVLVTELSQAEEFAIDVEASELDPMRAVLAGISVAVEPARAWYIPVKSIIEDSEPTLTPPRESFGLPIEVVRTFLGPVLKDGRLKKIGQNIKYDVIVLANAGFEVRGVDFDTMIASYCLHPARKSHGLDSLAGEILDHKMITFKELFDTRSAKRDIREVRIERVTEYACEDADMTLRLKRVFEPLLRSSQVKSLFRDVEMPLSGVLTEMELCGVKLDTGFLEERSRELTKKLHSIEEAVYQEAGERFNINSTPKLREILFTKLGLTPKRKTKTGYSTDVDVLKALAEEHPLPKHVLEYRTITKLKNTYFDALPKLVHPLTKRVHTSFNQAVTTTGRLSSSDPNLQNIPIRTLLGREIRRAFVSSGDDWELLDADYSQVELRILAHLSGDIELCRAFEEDADVHRRTAARILGVTPDEVTEDMRSRAKTVNFGIIYGMGPRGLAQALDIDLAEARQFIEDYFTSYPGVKRFVDRIVAEAKKDKAVSTLLGRVRQLPDIDSKDSRLRSFSERVAVNTPVQGTAADIIKVAMVKIAGEIEHKKLRAKMILQVHDELLFDVPTVELDAVKEIVKRTMENAIALNVPLKVDMGVGTNWLDAHG